MPLKNTSTRRPVEILTPNEVDQLRGCCSLRAPTGVRNYALITTLHRTGIRCGELIGLMPRDVDLDAGELRVRHGKGDKARPLGLNGDCRAALALWEARRSDLGLTGRHPLFCTLKGLGLQDSYVRHLFLRLGEKAGIEKPVHPHALRHAFAHGMDHEGVPLSVLRDALGHSSVAVTDAYLRKVSARQVTETMQAR